MSFERDSQREQLRISATARNILGELLYGAVLCQFTTKYGQECVVFEPDADRAAVRIFAVSQIEFEK